MNIVQRRVQEFIDMYDGTSKVAEKLGCPEDLVNLSNDVLVM